MKNKLKIPSISFLCLLFFLSLIECQSQNKKPKLVYITKEQYYASIKDSVSEPSYQQSGNVTKSENKLVLNTKAKKLYFTDNKSVDDDNDSFKEYNYLYYLKQFKRHIIKYKYFEGEFYLLINDNNAKIDTLQGKPIVIKNNLLTIYQDISNADSYSIIKTYDFDNINNLKVVDDKKEKWVLQKKTLLKNNNILLVVNTLPENKRKFAIITFDK